MDLAGKLGLAWRVVALRRHDRWSRERLLAHQRRRLRELVRFARARSPYYARALGGGDDAPLAALPVLTREALRDRWDELVTDRALRLDDLRRFLDGAPGPAALHAGRYQVMSTSGTTGVGTVFCYDPREWREVIASSARLTGWRGIGPSRRARTAIVVQQGGAAAPPMGARIGATMQDLLPIACIDASLPLAAIVAALEAARPAVMSAYAGTLTALAEEQLAGRLRIAPRMVQSTSEVLSPAARARITAAFGVAPHDTYAMTEAGMVAGTCDRQAGLHVEDDQVILEVLDEDGRPAAPGTFGSRVLLTVLWSRTVPLIRYEITDRVCLAAAPCPCGRPFTTIAAIDGRAGDVLTLPGAAGAVRLTPTQVQRILAPWPLATWQVRRRGDDLELLVVPHGDFDPEGCRAGVARALADAGVAAPALAVRVVPAIAPLPSGKVPRFDLR